MKICIFPGSFDPFTNGHMDILRRGAALFDGVVVGVLANREKKTVFSVEQRVAWIDRCIHGQGLQQTCSVEAFSGMTVDFVQKQGAVAILRGLRGGVDLEYESQIAQINKDLMPGLDTVFLLTDSRYAHLSSTLVRDVGMYGRDIARWVPADIAKEVGERLARMGVR